MSLLNGGGSLRALGLKALAVVFVLLMTELAPSSHAQLSELDTSAAEAAREIGALKKQHHKGQVKLVVANFWDLSGSDPRLGPELTDRFRTALERNAEGFTVLDRGNRSGEAYDVNDPKACQVNPFGANEVIDGYVESVRENIATVWVEAHGEPAINFMEKVTFTLPPELASLGPGSDSTSDRIRGKVLWVRADRAQGDTAKAVHLSETKDGYKLPTCVYCPYVPISQVAINAKMQGVVVFDVEIDVQGSASVISVVKPLPCGLTQQAVEAVRRWKFKSAEGPNGNPITAIVPIEVVFRLY